MKRVDYSEETNKIISLRAGIRCSFPDCTKKLIEPGKYNNQYFSIGEIAHIFSASKDGTRGNGGLTLEDLQRPENGILLCRNHHKIVDVNYGNQYPPEVLL